MKTKVSYSKCLKYSRPQDFIIESKYLQNYCRYAIKNNRKDIVKHKNFNRLKLISEGLPMPIKRVKECLYDFFSVEDAHSILEFSDIYILNY